MIMNYSPNFRISLWTSSHMWPCNVRVSLQKGQVMVAPSTISPTGYSVLRPQIGQVKGSFFSVIGCPPLKGFIIICRTWGRVTFQRNYQLQPVHGDNVKSALCIYLEVVKH